MYYSKGSVLARRKDNYLHVDSGFLKHCHTYNKRLCLYSHLVYHVYNVPLALYDSINLTPKEIQFNTQRSASKESVEWEFKDILELWTALDFDQSQRLFVLPTGTQYRVTVFFNKYTYLYL